MNYILRTLILASIMYVPHLRAMNTQTALPTQKVNLNATTANQEFSECASRVKKAQENQRSFSVIAMDWERHEEELLKQLRNNPSQPDLLQQLQATQDHRINDLTAAFHAFKEDVSSLKQADFILQKAQLTEAWESYESDAQKLSAKYTEKKKLKCLHDEIKNFKVILNDRIYGSLDPENAPIEPSKETPVTPSSAASSQTNTSIPEVSTSFAPVTSSAAPSTSSVAATAHVQAQSAAAQKDVVPGEHVEAIPLTVEQRAEERAKVAVAAQAKVRAPAAPVQKTADQASSKVSHNPWINIHGRPAVLPKTSLSWIKKLGLGTLAGSALYIFYALAHVYKGSTKSMIGYKSLSWMSNKLQSNSKGLLIATAGLTAAGILGYVVHELCKPEKAVVPPHRNPNPVNPNPFRGPMPADGQRMPVAD